MRTHNFSPLNGRGAYTRYRGEDSSRAVVPGVVGASGCAAQDASARVAV